MRPATSCSRSRLLADRPDRVGDEDVVDARVRQDLGLAEGRHRDPDRAGLQLPPGEERALVGLGVRAQRQAALVEVGLHPGDVGVDPVDVDHDGRRVEPLGQRGRRQGAVDLGEQVHPSVPGEVVEHGGERVDAGEAVDLLGELVGGVRHAGRVAHEQHRRGHADRGEDAGVVAGAGR